MSRSIVCSQCGHSLSMSDDIYNRRVAGKVVTIKCRQCSHPIRVDGRAEAEAEPAVAEKEAPAQPAPAAQAKAPVPYNDPLDPFSPPEPEIRVPPPRAPMPSLDEVVSSAPKIPTGQESFPRTFKKEATEPPKAPEPPAAPPRAPSPPGGRAAPPMPQPSPQMRPAAPPPGPSAPEAEAAGPSAPQVEPAPPVPVISPPAAGPPPLPGAPELQAAAPAAPVPVSSPFQAPPAPVVQAPVVQAPVVQAATQAATAPFEAAPAPQASGPVDLDLATMRDPHAAFRRRNPKMLFAAVAGLAAVMGGLIYASSGGEGKVAKKPVTQGEKPVIGVSLAPYRSDADETMPKAATPPAEQAKPAEPPPSAEPPSDLGSSEDFAARFKAASGRE